MNLKKKLFIINKPQSSILKNENGFSISSTMVAVAVAGILLVVTSKMILESQKVVKGLEQDIAYHDIVNDIKFFTADSGACTKYFGGQKINEQLKINNNALKVNIAPGSTYKGWKIKELKIEEVTPLPNPREAKLLLVAERVGKTIGVPTKFQSLLMSVSTDDTDEITITSCKTQNSNGDDGGGSKYDPASVTPPDKKLLCGNRSSYNYPNRIGGGVIDDKNTDFECAVWGYGTCGKKTIDCPEGSMKAITMNDGAGTSGCYEYVCYVNP